MINLRYINLGIIPTKYNWAIWEYARREYFKIDIPTVFSHMPKDIGIDMGTHEDMSNYLKIENIPKDWVVTRGLTPNSTQHGIGGPLFVNEDVMFFNFHLPKSMGNCIQDINRSILVTLREMGISCYGESNNLLLPKTSLDKDRKFSGFLDQNWNNGWVSYNIFLTFKLDYDLCNSIINFDGDTKWGKIKSLKDIAVGLFEIDESLSKQKISDDVIKNFAIRKDLNMENYTLSKEDMIELENIADSLLSDDWVYNLIHPEVGKQ